MSRAAAIALIVLLVVAGCLQTTGAPKGTGSTASFVPPEAKRPDGTPFGPLEAPPLWQVGEWWKIRLVDLTGATIEVTRVVAAVEDAFYLVGMPKDQFRDDLMVLHLPGFGQVLRTDLSFEIHDAPYQPLKFPLSAGDTWRTGFEGRAVEAKVLSAEGNVSKVQLRSPPGQGSDDIIVTYDARVRDIANHSQPGYAYYDVLDHGFNYTGTVLVPHMHDLVFQHFRIAGAFASFGTSPANPPQPAPNITETIRLAPGYDRASFVIVLVDISALLAGSSRPFGVYQESITGPGGKKFEASLTPADASPLKIATFFLEKPSGDWSLTHVAGGFGVAGAEGIAYHVYEFVLSAQQREPSTGGHQH